MARRKKKDVEEKIEILEGQMPLPETDIEILPLDERVEPKESKIDIREIPRKFHKFISNQKE